MHKDTHNRKIGCTLEYNDFEMLLGVALGAAQGLLTLFVLLAIGLAFSVWINIGYVSLWTFAGFLYGVFPLRRGEGNRAK